MSEPQEAEGHRDGRDEAPKPRYSRLAVAALVVVVLGFVLIFAVTAFTNPLVACFGLLLCACSLVLAIIAIVRIRLSAGRQRGYVSAVFAALVAGSVLLTSAYVDVFSTPRRYWTIECLNNLSQLSKASIACATDHNGQFPDPDAWLHVLESEHYLVPQHQLADDPQYPKTGRMYAMNAALGGCRIGQFSDRGRTVLFFECRPGAPLAGGPELLPHKPRYQHGYLIAFLDTHVECVPREKLGNLVWEPRQP